MTQANLLQLAQAGNAEAIAALMNASLQMIGVSARAVLRDDSLHVLLESDRVLAQSASIEFIRRGIGRLGLGWLSSAVVYSRLVGQNSPIWVEQLAFKPVQPFANPFVLQGEVGAGARLRTAMGAVPLSRSHLVSIPWWRQFSPLALATMLSVPMLILFSSSVIWLRYLAGGKPLNIELSKGLSIGGGNQSAASSADGLVEQAMGQARQADQTGKTAQSRQDWSKAASHWRKAIALLQDVPKDSPKAAIAQQKLREYRGYLNEVVSSKLSTSGMELVRTITGALSPKSVVHSGKGVFFAQNMMYNHTITVYDRDGNLLKTIPDTVKLADYGYPQHPGTQQGSPVEASFSPDGETAWVSNYQMYGEGFSSNADDMCSPEQNHDQSYLYRIGTRNLAIDHVVQVGAVPKYVATTPNNRYVVASNWCSWDASIVDTQTNKEIRRIQLGPYPRGIAIDQTSQTAYVAVMGSADVAAINLNDFSVSWIRDVGQAPRHLNIDPAGKYLYATLNGEGQVAKIDLAGQTVVSKVSTGSAPRSMAISDDGQFLYVVNYDSDTVSKVRTSDMQVVQSVAVNSAPIGITYDPDTRQVWVACYSGSIQVFQD
jgi:YVTN family beta-propeller protein